MHTVNQQTLCHFKLDFMLKKRNILPCLKYFNSILCAFWTTSLPFTNNRFDTRQLQVQNTSDKVVHKVVLYYMCWIEWGWAHPAAIQFILIRMNDPWWFVVIQWGQRSTTQSWTCEKCKKIIPFQLWFKFLTTVVLITYNYD